MVPDDDPPRHDDPNTSIETNRRAFLRGSTGMVGAVGLGTTIGSPSPFEQSVIRGVNLVTETFLGESAQQVDEQIIEQLDQQLEVLDDLIQECDDAREEATQRNREIRNEWLLMRGEGLEHCGRIEDIQAWARCVEALPEEPELETVNCSDLRNLRHETFEKWLNASQGEPVPEPEGDPPGPTDEELAADAAAQREREDLEDAADGFADIAFYTTMAAGVIGTVAGAAAVGAGALTAPVAVGFGVTILLGGIAAGQYSNYQNARNKARDLARAGRNALAVASSGVNLVTLGVLDQQVDDTFVSSVRHTYEQVDLFEQWPITFEGLDDEIPLELREFAKKSMYRTFAFQDYIWSWSRYDFVSSLRRELGEFEYFDPQYLWSLARAELKQVGAIAHNAQWVAELGTELVALRPRVNTFWSELRTTITESEERTEVTATELKQHLRAIWSNPFVKLGIQEQYNLDSTQFFALIEPFDEFLNQTTFQSTIPEVLLNANWESTTRAMSENLARVSEVHYDLAAELSEAWDFPAEESTPSSTPSQS